MIFNCVFIEDIKCALDAVNYTNENDNEKLRSAIRDLSTKVPDEKKLFLRNADDQFLKICYTVVGASDNQLEIIKQKAMRYLHDEYRIEEQAAHDLAAMVVTAFAEYGNMEGKTSAQNILQETLVEEKDRLLDNETESVNASLKIKDRIDNEAKVRHINDSGDDKEPTHHQKGKLFVVVAAVIVIIIAFMVDSFSDNDNSYKEVGDTETVKYEDWQEIDFSSSEFQSTFIKIPYEWTQVVGEWGVEISFSGQNDNVDINGKVSYWSEEGIASTDEERQKLWDEIEPVRNKGEHLLDSGSVTIDGVTCSWFKSSGVEDPESDFGYGYYLVIPYSGEGVSAFIEMYSYDYNVFEYWTDQIVQTISIS